MALLIADLAFEGDEATQEVAKTAVLVGSVLAAVARRGVPATAYARPVAGLTATRLHGVLARDR